MYILHFFITYHTNLFYIIFYIIYIDISDMRHIISILWSHFLTSNATAWHSTWSSWHKAFNTAVVSFVELSKITGKSSLRSVQKKPLRSTEEREGFTMKNGGKW